MPTKKDRGIRSSNRESICSRCCLLRKSRGSTPKYEPIKAITFHTRTTAKFYGDDYAVE